jgi:hypothetical protein
MSFLKRSDGSLPSSSQKGSMVINYSSGVKLLKGALSRIPDRLVTAKFDSCCSHLPSHDPLETVKQRVTIKKPPEVLYENMYECDVPHHQVSLLP